MVLDVCRRILQDPQAAEDVFQATFLVLAKRANGIQRAAALPGFLHGVAFRLAVRARRRKSREFPSEICDVAIEAPESLAWKEALGILDHEVEQLSERLRTPLVLCHLQGRTQGEAARQLGWSLNTLRRRLTQARRLLEARLRGRGVTLPAAWAGLLASGTVVAPSQLQAATLAAASAPGFGSWTAGVSAASALRKGIGFFFSTSGKSLGSLVAIAFLGAVACCGYWVLNEDRAPAASLPAPMPAALGTIDGDPAVDPLTAHGTVRLGTAKYRLGGKIESMAVSTDGKLAVAAAGWASFVPARVFDLTDGRCLHVLPYEFGRGIEAVGLSPDGKTLAAKDDRFLYFRNAATGKELRKFKYLGDTGGSRAMTDWLTFTPDGKHLAATLMGDAVQLIEVETGKVIR